MDLWFVDQPARQPDLAHLRDLLPSLTPQRRAAILAIKHARSSRPEHRAQTTSYHVYRRCSTTASTPSSSSTSG